MGDFVTNPANVLFPDKSAHAGVVLPSGWTNNEVVRVSDIQAIKGAAIDLRAALTAAIASAQVYPDTTTGLAATATGGYFNVPSTVAGEALILYRNVAGVATEVARSPSPGAFSGGVNMKTLGATGDGATNDTGAFAVSEASTAQRFYLPEGTYVVNDSTALTKEYTGPGKFKFGAVVVPTTSKNLAVESAMRNATVLGDLTQFYKAIQAGAATVVLVGDSITEGVFQVSYEDSWASLFANELRRRMPGVVWTIQNLSLAGLAIGSLQSPTFVGGATNDFSTVFNRPKGTDLTYTTSPSDLGILTGNPDLWPSGSTTSKSWRDHVKDAAPDLVIIAHGQNSTDGDGAGFATNLKSFITYTQGWAKKPSVAVMTTLAPTRKQATWRGYASGVQVSADAARGVALETKATLLDANRVWQLLRDGVDVASPRFRAVNGFADYGSANWTTSGIALPAISSGTTLTFTAAGKLYNNKPYRDVHLSAKFTPNAAGQAFGLIYRIDPNNVATKSYEAQVNGAWVILYWGATQITSTAITQLGAGTTNVLDVVAIGARHQVRLNGVLLIDVYDYNGLVANPYGLELNGAGTVASLSVQGGVSKVVGPPIFLEDDLLGQSINAYWANTDVEGDGIHHPSPLGHYAALFASTLGLIVAAERVYNRCEPPAVSAGASATTGALASTDYVSISVGGTFGAATMISGSAGLLGGATTTQTQVTVAAGGTVNVAIYQNGVTQLATCTLTFAAAGTYIVLGTGTASHNGATIRHAVNAVAWRIK